MCKSPFFIKVGGGACNFIKKERDSDRWISQNFKITFFAEHFRGLLLEGKDRLNLRTVKHTYSFM